jgi:Tfp pilus assembly protein PilZ
LPIRAPVNLLAPLVNLSTTGLQALSPKALSIGQQVELDLHIPLFPAPLETRGRVRWTAPGKDGYRVGVMFTGLNARSEAYLKELDANPFLCTIGQSAFEVVRMGA